MEVMDERQYYVETSVWGMLPKGQPREMRRSSLQFVKRLTNQNCFVSEVVLREIMGAPEEDRTQINQVLNRVDPAVLEMTPEAEKLAEYYIASDILPPKKRDDALHVAIATVHTMDVLVSWNHRHIANVRKTEQYRGANLLRGFSHTPMILTPLEVLHE